MAAILIKVGALLIKTLAKPLSTRFQAYVMSHDNARARAVRAAQWLHQAEILITRRAEGRTGRAFIADMSEEKSLELAAKLASEGFVFFVGIVVVMFEYQRQASKDAAKKRAEHAERQAMLETARRERERLAQENRDQQDLIHRLLHRVDQLDVRLRSMTEEAAAAQAQKRSASMFGGFFGHKPVLAAQQAGR